LSSPNFCRHCGAPLKPGTEFCQKCGNPVKAVKAVPASRSATKLKALVALAIIIVAVSISGLYVSYISPLVPSPIQYTGNTSVVAPTTLTSGMLTSSSSTPVYFNATALSTNLTSIPNPPLVVGCYSYTGTQWKNVTCLSQESVLKQGGFPQCNCNNNAWLGIGSQATSTGSPATPITNGLIQVAFKEYPGYEYDSVWGKGRYSIQMNTNVWPFTCSSSTQCPPFNCSPSAPSCPAVGPGAAHNGWVQFVYQDFCGHKVMYCNENGVSKNDRFCIWNVDVAVARATNNAQGYYPDSCVDPGAIDLSSGYSTIITGWTAPGGLIASDAYLPCGPHGGSVCVWAIVAPDQFGLAGNWLTATGGVMGAGGGSQAEFADNPTLEQTNIAVASCPQPNSIILFGCTSSPQIAAHTNSTIVTAESSNLEQYYPSLTSYWGGTHWWLSSIECAGNLAPDCPHFVNYDYLGNRADFTVSVNPSSVSMYAGPQPYTPTNPTPPSVNVTSQNGVQILPITMSVEQGLFNVAVEDLSGKVCTFPDTLRMPLQPGSTCTFNLDITTNPTASAMTYGWTIWAKETTWANPASASTQFSLTILPTATPSPVIASPLDGSSFNLNQPVSLIGYAHSTEQGQLGDWLPCSSMQFQAAGQTVTPSQDTSYQNSYQNTGYCDAQMTFTVPGPTLITLSASNAQGATGTAEVTITINSQQQQSTPFTFTITTSPTIVVTQGTPYGNYVTVTIITTGGTPQPVELSVSGLPTGATYTFSSNTVTPTTTVTLTIIATYATPPGTYTVTITGVTGSAWLGKGSTASTTIQLAVQSIG